MTIRKGIRIVVLLPTTATTSTASATSTANTASSSSATSASNNHSTMSRTSTSSTGTTFVRVGDHTMESVHPCLWNYGKVGAFTFSDFCMRKLMCLQYTFVFASVHMCALTLPKTCVSVTVCAVWQYIVHVFAFRFGYDLIKYTMCLCHFWRALSSRTDKFDSCLCIYKRSSSTCGWLWAEFIWIHGSSRLVCVCVLHLHLSFLHESPNLMFFFRQSQLTLKKKGKVRIICPPGN